MTNLLRACTLESGSSGNCIYIESGQTAILVDAGSTCKKLEVNMRLQNIDPWNIDAILVTHEHMDHVSGISVLARRYDIPVFASYLTCQAMRIKLNYANKIRFCAFNVGESFRIGDFVVEAFHISHDAVDPVAYRLDSGTRIVSVVTDIGGWNDYIGNALAASDLIFLEANYDEDMLWNGSYPWQLKQRISSGHGHLSNAESAEACCNLIKAGTGRFVLIHLSENNNRPELAFNYFQNYLANRGMVNGLDYTLTTADRYKPGLWQIL